MESGEISDHQVYLSSHMGLRSEASDARLNLQLMSSPSGGWYWLEIDLVTSHVISAVSDT